MNGSSGSSCPRSDLLQRTIASSVSSESWVMIIPLEVCPIRVPAPPDPLDQPRDLPGRVVLDDAVEEPDVDARARGCSCRSPRESFPSLRFLSTASLVALESELWWIPMGSFASQTLNLFASASASHLRVREDQDRPVLLDRVPDRPQPRGDLGEREDGLGEARCRRPWAPASPP